MLVDNPLMNNYPARWADRIAEMKVGEYAKDFAIYDDAMLERVRAWPLKHGTGIYEARIWGWDQRDTWPRGEWEAYPDQAFLERLFAAGSTAWEYEEDGVRYEDIPPAYGSCDFYRQVLDRWPLLTKPGPQFTLVLRRLYNTPDNDFRWHKNGGYMGIHELHGESFSASPHIKQVLQFRIYRRKA